MVKTILDMCCGGRMFYYQPKNPNVMFCDIRCGKYDLGSYSTRVGQQSRSIEIQPDVQCDFRNLPFEDEQFSLVIFDPPHLKIAGPKSYMAKKYGKLNRSSWPDDLKRGFNEAMRVLKPDGTLVFKWSDYQIPVSQVLKAIDYEPLFGDRRGKTRWLVFYK